MRKRAFLVAAVIAVALMVTGQRATAQLVEPQHPADPHHRPQPQPEPGFQCADCHACEYPTPADPCLVVCPRHSSHFFGEHGADDGPEIVIIDQLSRLYGPVVFAHKLHADMSAMTGGCENCHHYSEKSGTIPSCRECHDAERNPTNLRLPALKGAYHRQCMNCHRDWSHENACGFCHEQAGEVSTRAIPDTTDIVGIPHPKITATETYIYETSYAEGPLVTFHHSDHVDLFGQRCADCHRGESCSRCHSTEPKPTAHLDHLTTCCTCHAERDCAFCHTQESQPKFEHATSTGWDLNPHHDELTCTKCHGDPGSFKTPQTECTSCHIHWGDESFDHSVTGLTLNDEHADLDCESCHMDRKFAAAPSCDECHDDDIRYPAIVPGKLKLHR